MSRTTKTLFGQSALKKILDGVNAIYVPVKSTFGPEGKNALLYRTMNRGNRVVNDGVTVAECQEPKDQFIRMTAQTFKEACKRTNEKVGDGTTCTTILGGKLFNELYKTIERNAGTIGKSGKSVGVMSLKKEILSKTKEIQEFLKKQSKPVKTLKDLEKIAIVSVENEELGKTIAKIAWEVGVDGFIDVVEGYKGEIETEVIKGMRFPAKVAGKGFVNNPQRFEMIAKDCGVILTNFNLDSTSQVANFLNPILEKVPKVVLLAPSFSNEVLNQLYKATYDIKQGKNGQVVIIKGNCDTLPVLIPSLRTEQLEDLAVYFGARFIDKGKGNTLGSITEKDLGFVGKLVVKDSEVKEDAVASEGGGTLNLKKIENKMGIEPKEEVSEKTKVEERLETLKKQLIETKQVQFKKLLERRIASMASAIGIIRVGDSTQANSLYTKLKVEDAVYACKSALRGGYVKGGGLALKEIADKLDENHILKTTLLAPYEQIQSSVEGGIKIGDDILDPTEAIHYALEHSSQVVANLITVDSITCEEEDPVMGEGEFAIARALQEFVKVQKIKEGQWKEGQEEYLRDSQGGFNDEEFSVIHQSE